MGDENGAKMGPGSPPVLKLNDYKPAFLKLDKNNNIFVPSASSCSFSPHIKLIAIKNNLKLKMKSFKCIRNEDKFMLDLNDFKSTPISFDLMNIQGRIIKKYYLSGGKIQTILLSNVSNQILIVKLKIAPNENYFYVIPKMSKTN